MGDDTKAVEQNVAAINLNEKDDDFVDPWNVESKSDTGIDYDKLIGKYHFTLKSMRDIHNVHFFSIPFLPQSDLDHPKLTMQWSNDSNELLASPSIISSVAAYSFRIVILILFWRLKRLANRFTCTPAVAHHRVHCI